MEYKYKSLFLNNTIKTWRELEIQIEQLQSTKAKGDAFEEFVYLFFKLNKEYYQIKNLYKHPIPAEIKEKLKINRPDAGIDGVIIRDDNKVVAYQAKFRVGREKPGYGELSKLWAEAQKADFTYIVANCSEITDLANKQENNLNILVDRFDKLHEDFFNQVRSEVQGKKVTKKQLQPWPHQIEIIKNTVKGFETESRGKVIAACGTGKTMTSLWISECLDSKMTLFVAPSLALIRQTLEEWSRNTLKPFRYLCICSDRTVADIESQEFTDELGDFRTSEVDFPVTTATEDISRFIRNKCDISTIIFSTYQSLEVLADSIKSHNVAFDFAVFDEAHRTAGIKETMQFSLGLDDLKIPIKKRLFMTATERLIRPRLKEKYIDENKLELFSMDDQEKYGKLFSKFNFGDAIQKGVIADYRIVIAAIKSKELFDIIKKNEKFRSEDLSPNKLFTFAQSVFKQVLISNVIRELDIKKIISFHSSVKQAKAFIEGSGAGDYRLLDFFSEIVGIKSINNFFIGHVNGSMSAGARKEILDRFESTSKALVSNAKCLTEGVNLPDVDTIYFVDSKHSMIDIIQACGRALRKNADKNKIATFVIPILIDDSVSEEEYFNNEEFTTIHNVVQALRDQDNRLANWIDELNLRVAQQKTVKCGVFNGSKQTAQISVLSNKLDLNFFSSKIATRIATINYKPKLKEYDGQKVLGKVDRKSSVPRLFKTMGDYGVERYWEKLVYPTLQKIKSSKNKTLFSTAEIKANNNNVSHALRLGVIKKVEKNYQLTTIGKKLINGSLKFENVFKSQLLKFSIEHENKVLFPYTTCLYILQKKGKLTFLEFVYSLYSLQGNSSSEIEKAIEIIDYIREKYPIVDNLSSSNKKIVIDDLNGNFGYSYKVTDIWGEKQTTINNQFIYFKNHLEVFGDLLEFKSMEIILKRSNIKKLEELVGKNPFFNKDEVDLKKMRESYFEM